MITKTNFQMTQELKNWFPEHLGIISGEEAQKIFDTFQLAERDEINLRNLRDFCVMFYSKDRDDEKELIKNMDKVSAIVAVIDEKLLSIGAEA